MVRSKKFCLKGIVILLLIGVVHKNVFSTEDGLLKLIDLGFYIIFIRKYEERMEKRWFQTKI
jgi:hypothetical protein